MNEKNGKPMNGEELIDGAAALRDQRLIAISRRAPGKKNEARHQLQFFRYCTKGLRAADGTRVTLECVRTPWGRRTSREAIGRFISALCGDGGATLPSRRGHGLSQQSVLDRKLDAAGIAAD